MLELLRFFMRVIDADLFAGVTVDWFHGEPKSVTRIGGKDLILGRCVEGRSVLLNRILRPHPKLLLRVFTHEVAHAADFRTNSAIRGLNNDLYHVLGHGRRWARCMLHIGTRLERISAYRPPADEFAEHGHSLAAIKSWCRYELNYSGPLQPLLTGLPRVGGALSGAVRPERPRQTAFLMKSISN